MKESNKTHTVYSTVYSIMYNLRHLGGFFLFVSQADTKMTTVCICYH